MTPPGRARIVNWPSLERGRRRATDDIPQESLAAHDRGLMPSGEAAWQLEWRALRLTQANTLLIASAFAADQLVDQAKTFCLSRSMNATARRDCRCRPTPAR